MLAYISSTQTAPTLFVLPMTDCMNSEFLEEDTLDLVEYMRMTDPKDLPASDEAFIVFILRFREYLQLQCRRVADSFGIDHAEADEIATETFRRFRAAKTFKREDCGTTNIDNCIKLYLAKIAKHAMVDLHRSKVDPNPFTGEEVIVYDIPDMPDFEELDMEPERIAILKKKDELLREILYNRLSYKHRVVYLTYKQYERDTYRVSKDGTKRQYYLPRHLTKKLQDELQIRQPTIRKYKEEANAIIEPLLKIYG